MKSIFIKLFRLLYETLVLLKILKPLIVVHIDGGICSQMHQYLLGYLFKKKGFSVKYDLTWFADHGMDINNKDVRNFDLLRAFPSLNFSAIKGNLLKLYRYFYVNVGEYPKNTDLNWVHIKPPKLLLGYYASPDYLYEEYFHEAFKLDTSVLDAENLKIYQLISSEISAAVHVRRGDLAVETKAYGKPASLDYFKNAISYLKKERHTRFFYFFSDDKIYLKKELLPYLGLNENEYQIIQNGADKGYVDLILMSKCKYIVTSKGSLGKFAALLDLEDKKIVTVCKDDKQTYMLNVKQIEKILF